MSINQINALVIKLDIKLDKLGALAAESGAKSW